jgi:hypothetical protein
MECGYCGKDTKYNLRTHVKFLFENEDYPTHRGKLICWDCILKFDLEKLEAEKQDDDRMANWLVIEDISGNEPRLEAIEYRYSNDIVLLAQSSNINFIWKIFSVTKKEALQVVKNMLRCGDFAPFIDSVSKESLKAYQEETTKDYILAAIEVLKQKQKLRKSWELTARRCIAIVVSLIYSSRKIPGK